MSDKHDLKALKMQAEIELRKLEARATAKEVASKAIGKNAIVWIVLLVIVGVVSATFLPPASLAPVIGLVATASMALIQMLAGITGTKEKEEKPEFTVIKELIARMDKEQEEMSVEVDGDKVAINRGGDKVVTNNKPQTQVEK
jgi:hypothetical protein